MLLTCLKLNIIYIPLYVESAGNLLIYHCGIIIWINYIEVKCDLCKTFLEF